jgi:hypothetical protein
LLEYFGVETVERYENRKRDTSMTMQEMSDVVFGDYGLNACIECYINTLYEETQELMDIIRSRYEALDCKPNLIDLASLAYCYWWCEDEFVLEELENGNIVSSDTDEIYADSLKIHDIIGVGTTIQDHNEIKKKKKPSD